VPLKEKEEVVKGQYVWKKDRFEFGKSRCIACHGT